MSDDGGLDAYKVALGSIYLTLQNILSTTIGVLGFAFLARAITQEEMGIVAALTLLTLLVQVSTDFGLNTALAKFISELRGKGEDISSHVLSSLAFRLSVSLLAASAVFFFSREISLALFKTEIYSSLLKFTAIDTFLLSMIPLFDNVLLGSGRLKDIAIYGISSTLTRWLLIVFFLYSGYGVLGVIIGKIFGSIAQFVLYSYSISKIVPLSKNLYRGWGKHLPRLLRFSWPLYVASAVFFVYTWYDRALVLAYLPLTDLGVYDVSYKAFSILMSVSLALGSALFPYYGMAYGRRDHEAIRIGIRRASKYTMLAIFPMTLMLFATSRLVITLFAGEQYELGWPVLATLSLFGLVLGLASAISNLLLIYERTRIILLLSFMPVILSLALLPLVSILNLIGLAIIKGTSMLLNFLLCVYALSKILKVEIDTQALIKTLASSVIMAVTVLVVQQFYYNRFLFPIYALVGILVYVSSIRLMRVLDQSDFQLLEKIVGERATGYIVKIIGYGQEARTSQHQKT